jgi:hypothetical protein
MTTVACGCEAPGVGIGGTADVDAVGAVDSEPDSAKFTVNFAAAVPCVSDIGTTGGTAEAGRSVSLVLVDLVTIEEPLHKHGQSEETTTSVASSS